MKTKENYPSHVYFIIAHEFFERYAYYGVRSILILYLKNYLSLDNDASTIIYHLFVAACYLFPLMGGILSDSYWGKVKTILVMASIYQVGLVLLSIASLPQLGEDGIEPGNVNKALTYVALTIIAIGNGGIKPCVATLGGDQFTGKYDNAKTITSYFSMFYGAINAGSMLSTLVSPILREEVECFDREDCFFAAFTVPTATMAISLIVFSLGAKRYRVVKPSGNVFVRFCKATFSAIIGKIRSKQKLDHFMDYANDDHSAETINDSKRVFPVLVMLLPMPFFWALFDMKGSRWVLTATQMNGWVGGDLFKVKPDQIQLANPIMTLLFLPIFTNLIYPALNRCGIKVTLLRRMTAGQLMTALSFVVACFLQQQIDGNITPIPSFGTQNSIMVLNGAPEHELYVESSYWKQATLPDDIIEPCGSRTNFTLFGDTSWRTETFSWIREDLPDEEPLKLNDREFLLGSQDNDFDVKSQEIKAIVVNDDMTIFEYVSPQAKSDTLRVKCVLVNPSRYWIYPRLVKYEEDGSEADIDFSGNDERHNWAIVSERSALTSDAEVEQGTYKVIFDLYEDGEIEVPGIHQSKSVNNYIKSCETTSSVTMLPGSIWTFMLSSKADGTCSVVYGRDSKANEISILWLIPQYAIITVGELLNSATGNEFAYTQAPKSMKGVIGSFWFLTTFFGNILDVFFVKLQLWPTQSGEYLILALVMTLAALVFGLLSHFYYTYADFDQSDSDETEVNEKPSNFTEL